MYILADDLGLGDVRSYTANSPIPTPSIDRIASDGMRFINAHSPSAVCSPTRYGILTGEYAWRAGLEAGIVRRYEHSLIRKGGPTVARLLRKHGYRTAAFGKWHLGLNWQTTDGLPAEPSGSNADLSRPFTGGPLDHGFDVYFGDDVTNLPPATWIENDRAVDAPYDETEVMPRVTARAVEFVEAAAERGDRFFTYVALTAPHPPIVPPDFITTGTSDYERFVATVDWSVGQLLEALERRRVLDDTLVIFTSDNGPSKSHSTSPGVSPGFVDGTPLRGGKGDIFEGGHRVPFLARWKPHIAAGSVSLAYIELNDLYGTVAGLLGVDLLSEEAPDSFSSLPAFLQRRAAGPIRPGGVHHSQYGVFALRHFDREGEWKLILGSGSGGMTTRPSGYSVDAFADLGGRLDSVQLYNLTTDVGEVRNLLARGRTMEARSKALELQSLLRQHIVCGRTTPRRWAPGIPLPVVHWRWWNLRVCA